MHRPAVWKRPRAELSWMKMARPERFELPTAWFVARYSIQLSYGRTLQTFRQGFSSTEVKSAEARSGIIQIQPSGVNTFLNFLLHGAVRPTAAPLPLGIIGSFGRPNRNAAKDAAFWISESARCRSVSSGQRDCPACSNPYRLAGATAAWDHPGHSWTSRPADRAHGLP